MSNTQNLKHYQEANKKRAADFSKELKTISDKLLGYEVFSGLGPLLYELMELHDISKTVEEMSEILKNGLKPRVQEDTQITEIPPEGIIITKPGTYTFASPGKGSQDSSKKLSWAPETAMGAAITIVSDDVTLDLAQGELSAKIQDSSQHHVGIFVYGASNVTIQNGSLTNMCLYGIQAELVDNLLIENIDVSGLEYRNMNIRGICPAGIMVMKAMNVKIKGCEAQYFYTSSDSSSGFVIANTLGATVENCNAHHLYNYAGVVSGFSYVGAFGITTTNCHSHTFQSHFGGNIRTGGHTVLGFMPMFCVDLTYDNCSAKDLTGSCDDCHGMSIFINGGVKINEFHVDQVRDGVTQFNSGAKATGLEIYGADVQITNCSVNNIRANNPQFRLSTGFSFWGEDISISNCTASNVSVSNEIGDKDLIMGTGTGFGWAPDARLSGVGATRVTYTDCEAVNCQVGFDTWDHIDSKWISPTHTNCAINILVEPGGTRTLIGTPCTEINPPQHVPIPNLAKNNVYPGMVKEPKKTMPAIHDPYPTGNINGLSIPSAFSRLDQVNSQWWFYVGLLQDNQGMNHSFEMNFIEPGIGNLIAADLDFTFESKGQSFHATSTYGGDGLAEVIQSVINSIGVGKVSAKNQEYSIDMNTLADTEIKVSYDAANNQKMTSMFTGELGQPGAAYCLEGKGSTWLWKYPKSGKGEAAPYNYSVTIQLIDERGMVPEGLGSYVGIDSVHSPKSTKNSSVEYAQPRLRVESWTIEFTRHKEVWPLDLWYKLEGFEESYSFGRGLNLDGPANYLWLDRQALFKASQYQYRQSKGRNLLGQILQEAHGKLGLPENSLSAAIQQGHAKQLAENIHTLADSISSSDSTKGQGAKQLYQGCWLPVILTEGPYAGSTLVFVAFWEKARPVANYDTDTPDDAQANSFINLYTGLLGPNAADTHSAYVISDLLNPSEAAGEKPDPENNYRIQFTKQFDSIGDIPDPQRWASEIKVTVKAHTQSRYALAAYAKRAGRTEEYGVDQDVTFVLKAVSPYTTTTTLSTKFGAPIYEGASQIFDENGLAVGSGWIEQMVGDPS